jgi:predicted transcriptional regulator of viral defense system
MPAEIPFDPPIPDESGSRATDAAIAALAARQHGVVSRAQLRWLGFTRHEIANRASSGRLHRIHRGVYAVGHCAVSREGEMFATVLAGGPGAVLSHESAAELWDMGATKQRKIDVTVCKHAERPGIRFHRAHLDPSEITERKGIPVTTPERTIIDLAATLTPTQLERAIRQAEYEHLTTLATLTSCLSSRHPGRGAKALRQALALADSGKGITRKKLERRFRAFTRKYGLPPPDTNVWMHIGGRWIEADCLWRKQRVIVELDGRAAHHNVHAFESDRARDRALHAAGWSVVRITWRQLTTEPEAIARDLYSLLSRAERGS